MTKTTEFTSLLLDLERDIADAGGEITLALIGPAGCGHGPNVDGQLTVDIWNAADEEPDQYVLDLHRDPAVGPDEHLDSVLRRFLEWLRAHGISTEDVEPPSADEQLCVSVSFLPEDWTG
jgi:hypothetical protein